MKIYSLLFLLCFSTVIQSGVLKDPQTRDEDISRSIVDVAISRNEDGMYVYEYTVMNSEENIGDIQSFSIDLECEHDFDVDGMPATESEAGYISIKAIRAYQYLKKGNRTPATIHAKYGNAAVAGFSDGYADWMVMAKKGVTRTGLKLISPAGPGLRHYMLIPDMDVDGWDYSRYEEGEAPWLDDFTVTGMIAAPNCPGVTPPVDGRYYPGSKGQFEPKGINEILTYSEPLIDRWHTDESTNKVTIKINYSEFLEPNSFKVEPVWASSLFNPVPGTSQTIILPLGDTVNKFRLTAYPKEGIGPTDPNRVYRPYYDLDEFEVRRDVKRTN